MQSVSLFSSNNVKWQIPWRTLSHLYLQGIFFMLLRPKCLDLIFIKTEPRCLDRKYSPFQTKLIFWRVFTPKVRTGSRNDLCMGHIGQYFLEETWKSSFWLSYLPLTQDIITLIQHWRRNANSLSWALYFKPSLPHIGPEGNFPYARLTKHYKNSPPSLLILEGHPSFDSL